MLEGMDPVTAGLVGSLVAGLMTGVGGLAVLFGISVTDRARVTMLGFAAGVMLAASFFSLIIPALDFSEARYGSVNLSAAIAVGGILLGAAAMLMADRMMPHEHFVSGHEGPSASLRRIWLFVIAITIQATGCLDSEDDRR